MTKNSGAVDLPDLPDGWHAPGGDHPCAVCQYNDRGPLDADDHPKLLTDIPQWRNPATGAVVESPVFHYDCIPPDVLFQHYSDQSNPHVAHDLAVRAAAEAGTHGQDLRRFMLARAQGQHEAFLEHHATARLTDTEEG
jgi:hypothetical protein